MARKVEFVIEEGDIRTYQADVIALKYAQRSHGADRAVTDILVTAGVPREKLQPKDNEFVFVGGAGVLGARSALFVGVPEIHRFGYPDIRRMMQRTLSALQSRAPGINHLAMTIHGADGWIGLDERESFLAQFLVCLAEAQTGALPLGLQRLTIVERDSVRVQSLRHTLDLFLSHQPGVTPCRDGWGYFMPVGVAVVGEVPHVFVAMAFDEELDDVFYFGIQRPIIAAGLLCDRVDKAAHFRGDIVDRIKDKIDTAVLVIADLTKGKPNVFFEAGYAQGRGLEPLLLICRSELDGGRQLQFDVRTNRCVIYDDIPHLQELLARELSQFVSSGELDRRRASLQTRTEL
jgi:hypothetical protein